MTLQQTTLDSTPRPRHSRRLEVWPIRTRDDYDRAAAVVNRLAVRPEESLSPAEQDRLEIFTDLIAAFDARHQRLPRRKAPVAKKLKFLMSQAGLTSTELSNVVNDKRIIQKVLAGAANFSTEHITNLARHFHVSPAYFFPE